MQTTDTARTEGPPSFETVWAALQELAASQKETDQRMKETDQRMKETDQRMKETDQRMKEVAASQEETARQIRDTDRQIKDTDQQIKDTDRQIKDVNKRFGDFSNRFGEVVEYMIAPNLREKFRELGLNFPKAYNNIAIDDLENRIFLEIDVMLENGEKALLVEVKTKLTTEDVRDHIRRLEKMRKYADLHGDKRTFLGAAAGVVMTSYAKEYALKQGLFVVEPSGETFNIISPEGKPKEW